jgi:acyl transferase domain-containing protein
MTEHHMSDLSGNEELTLNEEHELLNGLGVAIIGASGRFPGAKNISELWHNLSSGIESIKSFSDEELRQFGVPEELLKHPAYVKSGAGIDDVQLFDPDFFEMTPREAEITDPQHRILIECAHEALESAGYVAAKYPGAVGLYAGVGLNTYLLNNLMPNKDLLQSIGTHQMLLGNDKCYATSRIAYKLNLQGPCMTVDTACSTSLISIILAYKSLISYDCDMALAGAAKINPNDHGYMYEIGSINSPDGHCRAFDEQANGTVFGSGAGIVVLKRLEDAVRDRDNIQAVIRGAAMNNDGADKVGFTAPSVSRQRDVILQALSFAEVEPESISYVEAHGTGTRLGDPVEIAALNAAFNSKENNDKDKNNACAIGSIKTNIGHLETSAGVAGLIKIIESMRHKKIAPSLNFSQANSAIDFENSHFRVATSLENWQPENGPRRACLSSFGIGGTNGHIVVEEAPNVESLLLNSHVSESAKASLNSPKVPQLLTLSAKSPAALDNMSKRLANHFNSSEIDLKNAAFTLAVGREDFEYRRVVVADSKEQVIAELNRNTLPIQLAKGNKVCFLMPGQGVQHVGMAADFYQVYPAFRMALDEACDLLKKNCQLDIKDLLVSRSITGQQQLQITQTQNSQPAIFVYSYAMIKQLHDFGIKPDVMLGHSLGEYVAACIANVMSLEDALTLLVTRANLMSEMAPGQMASLAMSESKVKVLLSQNPLFTCDIAAINGPENIVISGNRDAVSSLLNLAKEQGFEGQLLKTSRGFHSSLMDPMLEKFKVAVQRIQFNAPEVPYISSYSNDIITEAQVHDPQYWVNHLRETVQFSGAVKTAIEQGFNCFIDIGPAKTMGTLAQSNTHGAQVRVINTSPRPSASAAFLQSFQKALGELWACGLKVDWKSVFTGTNYHRIELPTYPFEKRRCWIDAKPLAMKGDIKITENNHQQEEAVTSPVAGDVIASNQSGDNLACDTEALVASIWQDLLGIERIYNHDNFFELGGQSLLATRVITRICEETGVELPMEAIFDNPTVAGLAMMLIEHKVLEAPSDDLEKLLAEIEMEEV